MAFRMKNFGYEKSGSGYTKDGEYYSRRQALNNVRGVTVEQYTKLSHVEQQELIDERALELIVPNYMESLAERMAAENGMSIVELTRTDDWRTIREALDGSKKERNEMLYYLYQHGLGLSEDELQALYDA